MSADLDIWLDCDPGVDDVFGIILATSHPRINLIGVSTTSGNTTIQNTTRNTLNVLSMIGKENVPVYMGSEKPESEGGKLGQESHGEGGLGGIQLVESKATVFKDKVFELIVEKIMANKKKVIFICTGALTNLSKIINISQSIKDKIQYVSLMGGAIGIGNVTPAAQFNIYYDPISALNVFESGLQIVMVPIQVTHTAICDQKIISRMSERKSQLSQILIKMMLKFKELYFIEQNFLNPPIHDPCAVFYALQPHQFQFRKAYVHIDIFPSSRGRTNCDFKSKTPNTKVCQKMNTRRFWDVMMQAYAKIVPLQ